MQWMNYLNENAKELIINEINKNGNATVYYNIDHVSSSGMTRYITMQLFTKDGLIGIARERKIKGCGMNMAFAMLYDIMGDLDLTNKVWLTAF